MYWQWLHCLAATAITFYALQALGGLWPDPANTALETNLTISLRAKNMGVLGRHIKKGLRERKNNSLVLNMAPEQGREPVFLPRSGKTRLRPTRSTLLIIVCKKICRARIRAVMLEGGLASH